MNENQIINFRNGLIMALENACGYFNNDILDRKQLARELTKIANNPRFTVDLKCQEEFESYRKVHGTHIKIDEVGTGFEIRIFQFPLEDGTIVHRVDYDYYLTMTYEESEAEARAEREGEQAMNNWANGFY